MTFQNFNVYANSHITRLLRTKSCILLKFTHDKMWKPFFKRDVSKRAVEQ